MSGCCQINENESSKQKGHNISVMRQVHLIAALMIFLGFLGDHFYHPHFIYLALLVGVGLTISAVSGYCPMAFLVQKFPWNKGKNFKSEIEDPKAGTNSCC